VAGRNGAPDAEEAAGLAGGAQRSLPLNSHAKTTETRHATRLRTVTTDSGAS
jgi:hypothetical protein